MTLRHVLSLAHKVSHVLGGRIASGAAVAALPLATALFAATQSSTFWSWMGWICALIVTGILALTAAPWVPLLHRLPAPLGAPKVDIRFRDVEVDPLRFPSGFLLEVGVKPTTRLEDAVVNFQFPSDLHTEPDLGVQHVDVSAQERSTRGTFLPIDEDTASPIRWWASEEDIRAGSKLFYFVIEPESAKPRKFTVSMVVFSEKLHGGRASADFEFNWP